MNICFYAFANTIYVFEKIIDKFLAKNKDVKIYIVFERAVYKDFYKNRSNIKTFYLYNDFIQLYEKEVYKKVEINDDFFVDNFYSILDMGKFGYKKEERFKQEKVAKTLYFIIDNFFKDNKIDFMLFPDIETVEAALFLNVAKSHSIKVSTICSLRQLGGSFFSSDYRESLPPYYGQYKKQDLSLAKEFINKKIEKGFIRKHYKSKYEYLKPKVYANIFVRFLKSIKNHYKYEKYGIFDTNLYLRIRLNFEKYFEIYRVFKYKLQNKYFDIKDNKDIKDLQQPYILFLLQVTPESSINTYSPYFIDQTRAIDLIRLHIPSNYLLLVKEHPAFIGMRSNEVYKNLRNKSGIRLVKAEVDNKMLISNSDLVVTITGTVGLECILINKPVLMGAQTFYSFMVKRIDESSIKNINVLINDLVNNKFLINEKNKIEEFAKIFNIKYNFIINDPFYVPEVLSEDNIENFYKAILDHIKRLKECKKSV